ncbi:MAG: PstS family phosphate ABC transporter substrate-binding protein [Sphingobacteriales bacterium]
MKSNFILILLGVTFLAILGACNRKKPAEKVYSDTYTSGDLKVASDESFAPIIDQEIYIFKNDNPKANPILSYGTENSIVNLLLKDSVEMAFLSRDLTNDERAVLAQHNQFAEVSKFAIDAVAVIVNQAAPDTAITVDQIKKMLRGEAGTDRNVVFDNPNSSLVRYLKDLTGQKGFDQKNTYALKSNKEVIKYVAANPKAIGIVGFSWIDDPDADYAEDVKKVKLLAVGDSIKKQGVTQYFRPSQTSLFLKQYPLKRSLYVVNCTGRKGLGAGLELFIKGDKGQRIILRSGLLPFIIPGRDIIIHNDKL